MLQSTPCNLATIKNAPNSTLNNNNNNNNNVKKFGWKRNHCHSYQQQVKHITRKTKKTAQHPTNTLYFSSSQTTKCHAYANQESNIDKQTKQSHLDCKSKVFTNCVTRKTIEIVHSVLDSFLLSILAKHDKINYFSRKSYWGVCISQVMVN